jgi:hypothetical protein
VSNYAYANDTRSRGAAPAAGGRVDDERAAVCSVTGKQRHPSRAAAHAALADIRTAAGTRHRKLPRTAYRCPLCDGFHLSSQSRRQYLMWPGRRRA